MANYKILIFTFLLLLVTSLTGCTFGQITEKISRTPSTISKQGEGTYQYYILVKGKDNKMHLYPIAMPKEEEKVEPKPKEPKPTDKPIELETLK